VTTESNSISPDGRWVAAGPSDSSAAFSLYPVAGGEPRPIPGLAPQETPLRWSADGRSLFVRAAGPPLPVRVVRLGLETGAREPWLSVAPPDPSGVSQVPFVDLSSDGRGYVYSFSRTLNDLYVVEGLR
jgi:hypothetical protein